MKNFGITREARCVKREGGNNTKISRESLVSSRKFNKLTTFGINFGQSPQNELTSNYYRLTTRKQAKLAFTMADRLSRFYNGLTSLRSAFTMAEILLSLTIIGVVAAITLPSLTGNINERTWNTQRKALYSRMSQAISLMPALNGYGKLSGTIAEDGTQTISEDTAAETFITNGLSKVLKINNICDNENYANCGFPAQILPLAGTKFSTPKTIQELNPSFTEVIQTIGSYRALNTKGVAFETANGESIITFYNPNCTSALHETETSYSQALMCADFIYDLNGKKGPNTVGKDIGAITVLYSSDSNVVAPEFYHRDLEGSYTYEEAISECKRLGDEYRLPNRDEAVSMFYNKKLLGNVGTSAEHENNGYWSSTVYDSTHVWRLGFATGKRYISGKNANLSVRCVKR